MQEQQGVAPVSVIIPCYRAASVLGRAVASVLSQTRSPAELILVEDASGDAGATRSEIERLIQQHSGERGIVIRTAFLERNGGPGAARNTGWDLATQPYIAFLDADDAWHPQKLAIQLAHLESEPDCDGCGHGSLTLPETGAPPVPLAPIVTARRVTLRRMLFRNALPTRTVMLTRELPNRFPKNGRYSEDYALWLDLLASGRRLDRLDADLAFSFRAPFSAGGQSGRLWRMEQAELALFAALMRRGAVTPGMAGLAAGFSLLKFLRRAGLEGLRRLGRRAG